MPTLYPVSSEAIFGMPTLPGRPRITAPVSAGVYRDGAGGGFPTDTWHDANYWVAPIFAP